MRVLPRLPMAAVAEGVGLFYGKDVVMIDHAETQLNYPIAEVSF